MLKRYEQTIRESLESPLNDRIVRVSSRGSPITGTLLADFGAFLDYKFREYDYYIGVYDALVLAATVRCGKHFSSKQKREYANCLDALAKRFLDDIELPENSRGHFLMALLAQKEYAHLGTMKFIYRSVPKQDDDMRLIYEGLHKSLETSRESPTGVSRLFAVENEFFTHLANKGFKATPTEDGTEPLLTEIMQDPDRWTHELTKRMTSRLVKLEQDAQEIYEAREPDPEKRDKAMTGIMGLSAYSMQSITYKHPPFSFSPSTAPQDWVWRNIIPYEIAFDVAESDLQLTWQPTWTVGERSLVGVRGTLGFAGGVFEAVPSGRPNYVALGLDLTRLTRAGIASSWGITPAYYHRLGTPSSGDVGTWGFDVHAGFLANRLRLGLGTRNVNDANNTWFLTIGITDIPGMVYWLSR